MTQQQGEQRKSELPARREHDAGAQRLEPLAGKGPRRERHDGGLDQQQPREQEDHDPELVEAVGGAATIARENRLLHAQADARLAELQASRERLVSAADDERRRIERNLHDGAQQRLVAL